jgi:hypothetical protein
MRASSEASLPNSEAFFSCFSRWKHCEFLVDTCVGKAHPIRDTGHRLETGRIKFSAAAPRPRAQRFSIADLSPRENTV